MNSTIASCRWFHWRPKNQKSDPLPCPLWLNHSNIWSMGTDSVIQKFFFFWTDLSPCCCFDSLWSCCFYLEYHHQKEGKKYQHLSISSYLNTHFQHPFYSRTWQSFYLSFPAYDKQRFPAKDMTWSFLGLSGATELGMPKKSKHSLLVVLKALLFVVLKASRKIFEAFYATETWLISSSFFFASKSILDIIS